MKFFLNSLSALLEKLSPQNLAKLASFLAWLFYTVLGVRKKIVRKNIKIAFGDTNVNVDKMGERSLGAFLLTVLEFLAARKIFPASQVHFNGKERIDVALERGQGLYFVSCHQGNWELNCATGAKYFTKVYLALKPVGGPAAAAWVRARRAEWGVLEVPRFDKVPAWQQMVQILEKKGIVAIVVDQRRAKGVKAPLFGMPCMTNASVFRLWRTHPAPIIPVSMRRIRNLEHELLVWPELVVENDPSWSEQEFLERNAINLNRVVEQMVLTNPDEYFWMHDRFKGM